MSDVELRERITIDGVEEGAAKLNTMAAAAGRAGLALSGAAAMATRAGGIMAAAGRRIAGAFEGFQGVAAAAGGIAGVWMVAETVREVDHLYQSVMRVRDMTGMAADHAHAMFDMFELSGIAGESAERIITSMTRSAEKMSDGFGGVGTQALMVKQLLSSIGAKTGGGPEERILAMSKAAVAGKLNVDQLIRAFMVPRSQASQMMSMLKQGPEKLRAIQQDTLKGADVIDDAALESYKTMLQTRRELKDAWGDLVGVFYKNLLPAVTAVLGGIKKGFDDVMPIAASIGKMLSAHMDTVVRLTKTYVALLIAAKTINMFSAPEDKMGMWKRGKSLWSGAMGFMTKRAGAAGTMDFFAAKAANPGIGMFASVGGPLTRILGSVVGRLGIIGAIVSVVVVAFEMLKNNTLGIASAFKKVFGGIWDAFGGALTKIVGVLGLLWAAIRPIVMLVAGALLIGLLGLAKVVEFVGVILNAVMEGIVAILNGIIWLLNKIPGVNIDMVGADNATKAAVAGKRDTDKGTSTVNQDFRGSKFEITNNFPQGIDGGRVAVAFGDELARLGERRLDSGLRPLYSIR